MKTLVLSSTHPDAIPKALEIIQRGGLVAFPTDTVYGVGADVSSAAAIEKLFEAKGRDMSKAIPVLIGSPEQLSKVTPGPGEVALRLAQRFWPGPLTLVVAKLPTLPENLSPLPTVGVRMPDHPVALALLRQSGPLAVTSANLSGGPNPSSAQDVLDQLDGRIDLLIDGGICPGGLPSTVVDCTTSDLRILRQGPITLEELTN